MFSWIQWDYTLVVVVAAIVYGVCLSVSWLIAKETTHCYYSWERRERWKEFYGIMLVAFCTFFVVVNVVTLIGSQGTGPDHATDRDVVKTFGFEHDKQYPLVMGSDVKASAETGFFAAREYTQSTSTSVILLDFIVEDKSYIIEIPVSKITFVQSTTARPSASLHLDKEPFYSVVYEHGDSDCRVLDLFFRCTSHRLPGEPMIVPDNVTRRGLSPIIGRHLDSATITLTPAMYKAILGTS